MSNLDGCIVIGPDGVRYKLVLHTEEGQSSAVVVTEPEQPPFEFDRSQPIGPQIKALRDQFSMSLRQFATFTGVSYVALCRGETGKTAPKKATLSAIEARVRNSSTVIQR